MANRLRAAWGPGPWDPLPTHALGGVGLAAAATTAATKSVSVTSYSSGEETNLPSSPGAYASWSPPSHRDGHSSSRSPLTTDVGERPCAKVSFSSSAQDSADSLAETSRYVLREVNTQARFEALYRDSESRRKRREAIEREKKHIEEEHIMMLQSKHQRSRRASDPRWANEVQEAYARKQQALADRRQREAQTKENEALKECSFAPRLVSGDGLRRRKLAKARRILEELAQEQRVWTQKAEELQYELAHALRDEASVFEGCHDENVQGSSGESEALHCELQDAEETRATADRRFRIGMLQVLDNLARLQTQALATVTRALGQSTPRLCPGDSGEALTTTSTQVKDMCPAFDIDILPLLCTEVSRFDVPEDPGKAWEVPGALLRAPVPVPLPSPVTPEDEQADTDSGPLRDQARPWTWA